LFSDEKPNGSSSGGSGKTASPLDQAGWLSRLGFCWLNPLLILGNKRQLVPEDIPDLPKDDLTHLWAHRFRTYLEQEQASSTYKNRKPSLLRVFHKTFGLEWYYLGIVQLLNDLLSFSGPVLLKLIVGFIEDYLDDDGSGGASSGSSNKPFWPHAAGLLSALVGCYLLSALLGTQYGLTMARVQLHIRTSLVSRIYHQVLLFPLVETSSKKLGSGEVTNLMTVDTQRMMDAASSFHLFWSLPIQVGITLYLLYREVRDATSTTATTKLAVSSSHNLLLCYHPRYPLLLLLVYRSSC